MFYFGQAAGVPHVIFCQLISIDPGDLGIIGIEIKFIYVTLFAIIPIVDRFASLDSWLAFLYYS